MDAAEQQPTPVKQDGLQTASGFAWRKLQKIVTEMWRNATTCEAAVKVLNEKYPGRGNEVALAMATVHGAATGDEKELWRMRAVSELADDEDNPNRAQESEKRELYRTVNAARKAAFAPEPEEEKDAADEGEGPYERLPLPPTEPAPYQLLPR